MMVGLSGPDLHFQVYMYNEDMIAKTLKTQFLQDNDESILLKEKEKYTAVH